MEKSDRRKFLFAGLSLAALAATFRFARKSKEDVSPKPSAQPIRFLTQEGQLVEIEADKIPAVKKAASKGDIQNWVNKNKLL